MITNEINVLEITFKRKYAKIFLLKEFHNRFLQGNGYL